MEDLLLAVLEEENYKTTGHVVAEVKMEYAVEFEQFLEEYREGHHFSTCSTYMSPLMLVGGMLSKLAEQGRVERCLLEGENAWRKK